MNSLLKQASKNQFVKFGLPFLIMLVGGSFGLKYFAQLRYTFAKSKKITEEEAAAIGIQMKAEKSDIQREYERLKEADIDTWQNIRGPRPWEDSKSIQDKLRKQHN